MVGSKLYCKALTANNLELLPEIPSQAYCTIQVGDKNKQNTITWKLKEIKVNNNKQK